MAVVAAAYIALGVKARAAAVSPRASRYADRVAGTVLIGAGGLVAAR
jgi:threonine/homoserine/homoserine lactone efflux protein